MRYGMVIDLKRCSGCKTCSVVCKVANNIPNDIIWNRVLTEGGNAPDTAGGTWDNPEMQHWPVACQHCENPACTKVCPVGATWKDEQTGIVRQDYDKCIGCRMCLAACPYTGVRSFNWEEPAYYADFALGDADAAKHEKHTVEKCIFCTQRVARGEQPACVESCPTRALYFGELAELAERFPGTDALIEPLPETDTAPSLFVLPHKDAQRSGAGTGAVIFAVGEV